MMEDYDLYLVQNTLGLSKVLPTLFKQIFFNCCHFTKIFQTQVPGIDMSSETPPLRFNWTKAVSSEPPILPLYCTQTAKKINSADRITVAAPSFGGLL
jgi:hypothetical protein